MAQDIFKDVAALEQKADAVVAKARLEAEKLRTQVDARLADRRTALQKEYDSARGNLEQELSARRQKAESDLEVRMTSVLKALERVKTERVGPVADEVVSAFLERSDVH